MTFWRVVGGGASILFAAAVVACAPARPPLTGPGEGGPAWTQITSPHFVIETDLGEELGRYHAARFEVLHAAMEHVIAPPPGAQHDRIEILLFQRSDDFLALRHFDSPPAGYFVAKAELDIEPRPIIVMQDEKQANVLPLFLHELAHRMIRQRTARLPPWLDEGLAEYYSTLEIRDNDIAVGKQLPEKDFWDRSTVGASWYGNFHQTQYPASEAPAMGQLIGSDYTTFHAGGWQEALNYLAAWKLVHLFKQGPDERLAARFKDFVGQLERGVVPKEALASAFAGASLDDLERVYRAYLTEPVRQFDVYRWRPPKEAQVSARPMSDAEVHLLWARLRLWNEDSIPTIETDLRAAEASGEASDEVHYRRAIFYMKQGKDDEAHREIRAALSVNPNDPRYMLVDLVTWVTLQPTNVDEHQAEPRIGELVARLAGLSKAATSPVQRSLAAACYLLLGQMDKGGELLASAVRDDPTCVLCYSTYAQWFYAQGLLDEAAAALERARAMAPHDGDLKNMEELERKIVEARQQK